jgi:hypothetical protein
MKILASVESALAGACALTLTHELIRRNVPGAPRMDRLGMEALAKILGGLGKRVPPRRTLFLLTMAGDVLANTLYYSSTGLGRPQGNALRGTMLGLAAGIGAVVLPKHMGLSNAPSNRTSATKIMTVGLYLVGGVVTSIVLNALEGRRDRLE